jgi:adenine-specific DNA-methyltransferase
MSTRFFTNHGEQTLFKKFQGVFESNPDIEWFDALVGYLRSSGYFALRPYLEKVPHIRILVGINVDAIMADSRVFNDEAKPTFVWQLDFAEIFHRQRSAGVSPASSSTVPVQETEVRRASGQSSGGTPLELAAGTAALHSGFDLVLANPPYVRQERIKELKPLLQNAYDCYTGTADLYVYFYERGVKLLGKGGVLSFISSNKFFRATYGDKLRKFLREKTELQTVIDFGDLPIFQATAYPCIIVGSNRQPKAGHEMRTLNVKTMEQLSRFTDLVATSTVALAQTSFSTKSWQLESPLKLRLLDKLRGAGLPLTDYVNGQFYRGIGTGLNEAFIVDRPTRNRLVAEQESAVDVLKPYLRGRDVKRWRVTNQDRWLIYVPWHFPLQADATITSSSSKAEKEFGEQYPGIYFHLKQYKNQLAARDTAETGIRYEWYAVARPRYEIQKEFERPKIVYPDIYEHQSFAWDDKGFYPANTCYFIPTDEKWMTGLLNSSVVEWFYGMISNRLRGGYLRAFSDYMEQIPIPTTLTAERSAIEGLVEQCLAARGENCAAWEAEINARVFRLYGLTPEEIQLVEETTKK